MTQEWVVLLRGINVGGRNSLPMAALRDMLDDIGCAEVRTYIQSGNCVVAWEGDGVALAENLASSVFAAYGFKPWVLALPMDAFAAALAANPFTVDEGLEKTVHLFFMATSPDALDAPAVDTAVLDALRAPSEAFSVVGSVFYLHAPNGIGRSKLAARLEAAIGVDVTGRNLRTARAIYALARR